jgi:hypothetical protein
MRRPLLLAAGGLAIAGALLPWIEFRLSGGDVSLHIEAAKHGLGALALLAGCVALLAAAAQGGAAVSMLATVGSIGCAALGSWRTLHSPAYEIASAVGVQWTAGAGLRAMGLGAALTFAALLTSPD